MLNDRVIHNYVISRRVFMIMIAKFLLFILLIFRMFYIQFIKGGQYKTLSDKNRITMVVIPPKRGIIYDVNKLIISDNSQCFRLLIDKAATSKYLEEFEKISHLLLLQEDDKNKILSRITKAGYKVPIVIIDKLNWSQIALIEERISEFDSLSIDISYKRIYKFGETIAHVIGYVSQGNDLINYDKQSHDGVLCKYFVDKKLSAEAPSVKTSSTKTSSELSIDSFKESPIKTSIRTFIKTPLEVLTKQLSTNNESKNIINNGSNLLNVENTSLSNADITTNFDDCYHTRHNNFEIRDKDFSAGKSGVEKYYDKILQGKLGYKQIEVNAFGHYVRSIESVEPLSGSDIYLNIDCILQEKIFNMLSEYGASAVVMNCKTGGVMSLVSTPSFNPTNFNPISTEYWNNILHNVHKPLMNRTIQNLYPAGSIFKIITIFAALESGIDPCIKFKCDGTSFLGTNSFRCHNMFGHGAVDMEDALKFSCNSYIYNVAKIVGADKIIDMAQKFGFGNKTNIDLPNELSGFVPSRQWKKNKFGTSWNIGDTLNLAIGQGFTLCTPIQIANLITIIASDGKLFTPSIKMGDTKYSDLDINKEHMQVVKNGLYKVVNSIGGTGYHSRINYNGITISGKSGTAQVKSKMSAKDDLNKHALRHYRNHAMMGCYLPSDNPKYSILVYCDHGGGGGSVAAPIVKSIASELMDKI